MTGHPIREDKLLDRYARIADQLRSLFAPVPEPSRAWRRQPPCSTRR